MKVISIPSSLIVALALSQLCGAVDNGESSAIVVQGDEVQRSLSKGKGKGKGGGK